MAVNSLSDSIKKALSEALQLEELSAKAFGSKKQSCLCLDNLQEMHGSLSLIIY